MTYQGIDTAANITAEQARKLAANGVSFAARYLAPGKTLTAQEVKNLRDAGLAIMLCWETTASRVKGGAAAGAYDGDAARRAAEKLGIPAGTVVFFACDYNAPAEDFAAIEAYLRTAKHSVEPYGVGLYGPERVVAEMSARGACYYYWQCVAWSNQFLPCADVRQYAWQGDVRAMDMAKKCGIGAVDLDSAETLAGMWLPPEAPEVDPWYKHQMEWAKENGLIMDGRPNDYVTRAELATEQERAFDLGKRMVAEMISEAIKNLQPEDDKKYSGLLN